jgi:hypothetical protein
MFLQNIVVTYKITWHDIPEDHSQHIRHHENPKSQTLAFLYDLYRDSCTDLMAMLDAEGVMDIEKLKEWVEKSQLDPNDPRNASFFQFIKVRN